MNCKLITSLVTIGALFQSGAFAQTPVGGTITGQSWTLANSPYLATSDVIVSNLIIQPGVTVEFQSNVQFIVTGPLQAVGNSSNQISFQPATQGTPWGGILFSNAGDCQFQYCQVQGANNSGIRLQGTPITLSYCAISNNSATQGGGINADGPLTLQNCTIQGNSASGAQSGGEGGGVYSSGASLTVEQSSILNNGSSAATAYGGGIDFDSGGTLVLINSTVAGNGAAGVQLCEFCGILAYGGGIYLNGGYLTAEGSTITGNSATVGGNFGGGIYGSGSITLSNCNVSGNSASDGSSYGGGIYCGAVLTLADCLISGNSVNFHGCCAGPTYNGAAIFCVDSAFDTIQNCVISQNSGGMYTPLYEAIFFQNASGTASILNNVFYQNDGIGPSQVFSGGAGTIENCIFYDNSVGATSMNVNYSMVPGGYAGTNNVDSDLPVNEIFTDTTYFFLANGSPAIDAGDPNPVYNDVTFPPSKGGARNDMGAYGGPGAVQNLTWVPPLQITSFPPPTQTANFGSTVQLNAGVSGADGPVTYQWLFNGTNILGATNATYTIANFSVADIGAYSVTISDLARTITSSPTLLNVQTLSIALYPGVTVNGTNGESFLIQSTPTLGGGGVWTTLTNIMLTSPSFIFVDLRPATNGSQFYRAVPQ